MKGVMQFGKNGKLIPRYVDLYLVLRRVGNDIYELEFPFSMSSIHSLFHVFMLRKCVGDPSLVVPLENIDILDSLSYEEVLGIFYEDLVPDAKEPTGLDTKKVRYISQTYEYLFAAFHNLWDASQEVSLRDWITYWCKKPSKCGPAPPMKEKKTAHPELTHNPSGIFPDMLRLFHSPWDFQDGMNNGEWQEGNSDEVPINEALITYVTFFLNAKLPNQYANEKSYTPPMVYEGISLPAVEIHDDMDNPLRTISALADEVIIKEMDCKDVDISPLRKLLHDFFNLATLYDQARSMLYDMNEESAREELFYIAGERLIYARLKEDEKVKVSSSIRQSLQNIKKKIKELCRKAQSLEYLLDEAENEAKEAKLDSSVVAKEFNASFDADLSNGVDQKKEHLESYAPRLNQ
ncbi:hypothetical protein CQW23_14227 [Capsicum baccatum]|uniref:Tf2-1-like SH3-like domain-containing protein n=1 Tax=Capsicum baccatum TaxID=33114 RepID=A0A2G2WIS1_CAPBA|nr:hypothetical protein CQW23_14227 [Capsicum baccatum]